MQLKKLSELQHLLEYSFALEKLSKTNEESETIPEKVLSNL